MLNELAMAFSTWGIAYTIYRDGSRPGGAKSQSSPSGEGIPSRFNPESSILSLSPEALLDLSSRKASNNHQTVLTPKNPYGTDKAVVALAGKLEFDSMRKAAEESREKETSQSEIQAREPRPESGSGTSAIQAYNFNNERSIGRALNIMA